MKTISLSDFQQDCVKILQDKLLVQLKREGLLSNCCLSSGSRRHDKRAKSRGLFRGHDPNSVPIGGRML